MRKYYAAAVLVAFLLAAVGYLAVAVPAGASVAPMPLRTETATETADPTETVEPTETVTPTETETVEPTASPSPSESESGSTSASPSVSVTPTGTTSAVSEAAAAQDDSLPVTGDRVAWSAAAAAGLLCAGIALRLLTRRRKVTFRP